jgi:Helix-turn-helix domain
MHKIDLSDNEQYLKLAQMAGILNVKYETVLDWSKREDFPVLRPPGALRVKPSAVAKWLEQFQKEVK